MIAVRVGTEDQLLLWSSKGLDNWMFALRDAVNLSKGRREALRRSQTLMPQLSDGGLIGRLVQNKMIIAIGISKHKYRRLILFDFVRTSLVNNMEPCYKIPTILYEKKKII